MKKLKKLLNYLMIVGGILTALSGIVNTGMDLVSDFKGDKKDAKPVIEQRISGDSNVRISKTITVEGDAPDAKVAEVPNTSVSMEPPSKMSISTFLWWIIASIGGIIVSTLGWYLHSLAKKEIEKKL